MEEGGGGGGEGDSKPIPPSTHLVDETFSDVSNQDAQVFTCDVVA